MDGDFEEEAEKNASFAMVELGKLRRRISELEAALAIAQAMLKERDSLLAGAREQFDAAEKGFRQALNERDEWKASAGLVGEALRVAVAERVAAEAELARLKPSGQVAEDRIAVSQALVRLETITAKYESGAADALSRLAAKAQGYEAAVADNAALLEELNGLMADMHTLMAKLVSIGVQVTFTPDPRLQAVLDGDRPGAALLEQHRKEVAEARNEGLELAADMAWANDPDSPLAAGIRALKTCTDGSCAKCRSGEPCH